MTFSKESIPKRQIEKKPKRLRITRKVLTIAKSKNSFKK